MLQFVGWLIFVDLNSAEVDKGRAGERGGRVEGRMGVVEIAEGLGVEV